MTQGSCKLDTATETESKIYSLQISLNVHNITIKNLTAEKSIRDLVFDHNR